MVNKSFKRIFLNPSIVVLYMEVVEKDRKMPINPELLKLLKTAGYSCPDNTELVIRHADPNSRGIWTKDIMFCKNIKK